MKIQLDDLKLLKEQAVHFESFTKNGHNMRKKFEELGWINFF